MTDYYNTVAMEPVVDSKHHQTQSKLSVYDERGYRLRAEAVCFRDQSKEEILLVKCRKAERWKLPGGGLEPAETPSSSVIRELKEEGGVSGTILKQIGLLENQEKKSRTYLFTMLAGTDAVDDWPEKDWRLIKWCTSCEVINMFRKEQRLLHLEKLLNEFPPETIQKWNTESCNSSTNT